MSGPIIRIFVVLVLTVLASGGTVAGATEVKTAGKLPRPVYLVLDTSGSMRDGGAETKLDAAKRAAYAVIHQLDAKDVVGLRTYPGGLPVNGCTTGIERVPLGADNRAALTSALRWASADGGTPTGPTLLAVRDQFLDYAKRTGVTEGTVVLLSDGEANCGEADICEVGQLLSASGLALTVNTVGLDISEEGARQLQCLADATGGSYTPVPEGGNLTGALIGAARAQLSVKVTAPADIESVTGGREVAEGTNVITVTVSGMGAEPVNNARVSLSVADSTGAPGAVQVPSPIRHLGRLGGSVKEQRVTFTLRPAAGTKPPLTWTVTVSAVNAASVTETGKLGLVDSTSVGSAGPLLLDAKHIVVVGDSYSSGEGAGDYDASDNKDSGVFKCHRSRKAWGRLLGDPSPPTAATPVTMIACSGAVTGDMQRYQHFWDVEPQLKQLTDVVNEANPPDVVVMTLGGNDAGFADFVAGCFWKGALTAPFTGPCNTNKDDPNQVKPFLITDQLIKDVSQQLLNIDAVVNRPEVVARRNGRVAQIVLLPYMNPIPPPERLADGCFVGMSRSEAKVAQGYLNQINGALWAASDRASDKGVPMHIPYGVASAFQDGYTLCDGTSAVINDDPAGRKLTPGAGLRDQELMHPNVLGQRLVFQALVEWSRREPIDWAAPHRPAITSINIEGPVMRTYRVAKESVNQLAAIPDPRSEPTMPLPLNCTDMLGSDLCTTITLKKVRWVQIESEPRFLGVSYGDEPVFAGMRIPADMPAGEHTLVVWGMDESGQWTEFRTPITIRPPGWHLSVLTSVLGALCLLPLLPWAIKRHRQPVLAAVEPVQARRPLT